MNKKIIIVLVLIVSAILLYQVIFKESEPEYTLTEVKRDTVVQEISETGMVKRGEKIGLSFENTGRIAAVNISVGDIVKAGQALASLETSQLQIQLQEASAALELSQAELNKLLSGASAETIRVAQTAVDNAEISLENAQQNEQNVKVIAQEDIEQDYEDGLNSLDDAYLKIYNAYNAIDSLQRTYFSGNDQESITVKGSKTTIENAMLQTEPYIAAAKSSGENESIDMALIEVKDALNKIYNALEITRETCEAITYRDTVSSTDKTTIDTQKTNINTSLTSIISAQQAIASTKLTNASNINTAESSTATAEGVLKTAQDNLALTTADPRQEDIVLYQAKVQRAQSNLALLKNQIAKATLFCPTNGQVIGVDKKVGEMVQPTGIIITLLPSIPFQIETDIYEEDIVKINIGNPVDIFLIAFPDQIFKGKVMFVDPAEKLMDGVVYYKIIIDFSDGIEESLEGVKQGMTADLIIKTAQKENVLVIDEDAVQEKDDKVFVEVLTDGKIEEREIETGLLGSNDMMEIISGLEAGEKVILR
ncbi:efflux RND transporter periplasmic adaptor subunit [Candidatus Parcubacteria bacterium]|nr:efflux RND transporter periplasmic adaptor subunit [Candidatus Parcubacteria bacterium]